MGDRRNPGYAGLVVVVVVVAIVSLGLVLTVVRDRSAVLPTASAESVPVVLAAGDIARCDDEADDRVADLLDDRHGTVVTLGDNAYPSGTLAQFEECYAPSWGRHLARTRPATGNHDYDVPGAADYFAYFGTRAGDPETGYYAYPLGQHWHAIVLNSNCSHVPGGCDEDSPQVRWLEAELTTHQDKNILAYWHHPRFSSGHHGTSQRTTVFWDVLHAHGADVVLVSHDHNYERFARLGADGEPDAVRGIRQFVVGTGGGRLRAFPGPPLPTTEARDDVTHGVLRLELHPSSYRWEFIPIEGAEFTDAGSSPVNPRTTG